MFQPRIKKTGLLARHRVLAPTAGVHVSPLCLGAMNFGMAMKDVLGECSKETAFEILDYFYSQGGNFIDTANGYQAEESETWLGEWFTKTGHRDEMVLATKYTSTFKFMSEPELIQSNFGGNSAKSLHVSIEKSLQKLQTSYVDLLYVHYWDMSSSIPEVMQSLNHLVAAGKVLYLGISDTPAWVVAKCNAYARHHGLRPFSVYQGRWSAAERDFEREIIPMCKDEGMAIAPWGALGGGYFKPKDQIHKDGGRNMPNLRTGKEEAVSDVLQKMSERLKAPMTSIALAYVMHKAPYVFPIVGGRKLEHLKGNMEALKVRLSQADMDEIESAYDFDVGFPHNFLSGKKGGLKGPADIRLLQTLGDIDHVEEIRPIPVVQGQ